MEKIKPEHTRILNALATIMVTCDEYIMADGGCSDLCPFRRSEWEQSEGIGQCAFESSSAPIDWILNEPGAEEENPILLETEYCIEEDIDEDSIMYHIAKNLHMVDTDT